MLRWFRLTLTSVVRAFFWQRDGSVMPMFAIGIVPIIGLVGASIDYSNALRIRTKLHGAIDSAVLIAASQGTTAASNQFNANLLGTGISATLTFTSNADGSYTGTASTTYAPFMVKVLGVTTIEISTSATAMSAPPSGTACILLLDPSKSGALDLISPSSISAQTCEVHVASSSPSAAKFDSPSAVNFKRVCVAGGAAVSGGMRPNLETSCTTATDPFAGKLPAPSVGSCTYINRTLSGTVNPGTYCGTTIVSDGIIFNPGLYIIKSTAGGNGLLKLGASNVSGTGVTFYFADAKSTLDVRGGENIKLSAPTSGAYQGILMFQPNGLAANTVSIDSSNKWNWTGLIYTPSFDWTGISPSQPTMHITLVANSLSWNSMSEWAVFDAGPLTINVYGNGSSQASNAPRPATYLMK